jgi:hypothetical protein
MAPIKTPPLMNKEKQELMDIIVKQLGRDKAIEVVMAAYNTELVSNRLARMETVPVPIKGPSRDLLLMALKRVADVCGLV